MGGNAWKAFPTPGQPGSSLGGNALALRQSPALQPNYSQTPTLKPTAPLMPMTGNQGKSLQTGEAAIPTGQTAYNPWGQNRGGSGSLPIYRRPGTMP